MPFQRGVIQLSTIPLSINKNSKIEVGDLGFESSETNLSDTMCVHRYGRQLHDKFNNIVMIRCDSNKYREEKKGNVKIKSTEICAYPHKSVFER